MKTREYTTVEILYESNSNVYCRKENVLYKVREIPGEDRIYIRVIGGERICKCCENILELKNENGCQW